MKSLASPVLNLKALEFDTFSPIFTFLRYLKVVQIFQSCAETFHFRQAFRKKKTFEDSSSGFKISFQPYSDALKLSTGQKQLLISSSSLQKFSIAFSRTYHHMTFRCLKIHHRSYTGSCHQYCYMMRCYGNCYCLSCTRWCLPDSIRR